MGPGKHENVGKSQSVFVWINPITPPRTRIVWPADTRYQLALLPIDGTSAPLPSADMARVPYVSTAPLLGAPLLTCQIRLLLARRARIALGTATQCSAHVPLLTCLRCAQPQSNFANQLQLLRAGGSMPPFLRWALRRGGAGRNG
jgi:hypothetical protein